MKAFRRGVDARPSARRRRAVPTAATVPLQPQLLMSRDFVSRVSAAPSLKDALDLSAQRSRLIADRVAKASLSPEGGFALPAAPTRPGSPELGAVDLEAEMTSLADEQLRFEATAKLLQSSYAQIRASLRNQ